MEDFTTEQLSQLRDILVQHCTQDELKIFCADLGEDIQDIVSQNATKGSAANDIVAFFRKRERLGELIARVLQTFPNADWRDLAAKAAPANGHAPVPTLAVLFAAPLIYEAGGERHPIDPLDFEGERDLLLASLREAERGLTVAWRRPPCKTCKCSPRWAAACCITAATAHQTFWPSRVWTAWPTHWTTTR